MTKKTKKQKVKSEIAVVESTTQKEIDAVTRIGKVQRERKLKPEHLRIVEANRKHKAGDWVEYDSNNSGGHWWLKDKDWYALEKAGWIVEWHTLEGCYDETGNHVYNAEGLPVLMPKGTSGQSFMSADKDGRWLGALAGGAYRKLNDGDTLRSVAEEWESITGACSTDAGCPCCGQPHRFVLYRNGKWTESGPDISYEARW